MLSIKTRGAYEGDKYQIFPTKYPLLLLKEAGHHTETR